MAPARIPPQIDLRPQFAKWGLSQRLQGECGTCSVFATVEAIEFAIAHAKGDGEQLSVEFANWAANSATGRRDDGDFFHNIIRGVEKFGLCAESAMPYRKKFSGESSPSAEATAGAVVFRDKHGLTFHWIRRWTKKPGVEDGDIVQIKSVLASGYPVSAGSYHSVLLVGYEDDPKVPGSGRFLVADSQGRERELTYQATKERMSDVFWVTAEPKGT